MTKQQEIRDGIAYACKCGNCQNGYIMFRGERSRKCYQCYKGYKLDVDAILTYLHSQGVVIKVERELPKYHSNARVFLHEAYPIVQKELVDAGCGFFESLIGEE